MVSQRIPIILTHSFNYKTYMTHFHFASWRRDPFLRKVWRPLLHTSAMEVLQIADHNDIIFAW